MRREFRNQLAALRRQMPSAVEGKSDNADSNLGLWLRNTNFLISRAIPVFATEGRMYRVFVWTAPGTVCHQDFRKLARVSDDIR